MHKTQPHAFSRHDIQFRLRKINSKQNKSEVSMKEHSVCVCLFLLFIGCGNSENKMAAASALRVHRHLKVQYTGNNDITVFMATYNTEGKILAPMMSLGGAPLTSMGLGFHPECLAFLLLWLDNGVLRGTQEHTETLAAPQHTLQAALCCMLGRREWTLKSWRQVPCEPPAE